MSRPDVISRYFEADARRDIDAIVALFTEDAVVVDEGKTWRGIGKIRAWREGPASLYQYTTEVFDTNAAGEDEYLVTGRLEGNFPGGTAELKWRFTLAGDRISHRTSRPKCGKPRSDDMTELSTTTCPRIHCLGRFGWGSQALLKPLIHLEGLALAWRWATQPSQSTQ